MSKRLSIFRPLLRWRFRTTTAHTAETLVEALSVEGLPDKETPRRLYDLVVQFRHLRQDERLRICKRFLSPGR